MTMNGQRLLSLALIHKIMKNIPLPYKMISFYDTFYLLKTFGTVSEVFITEWSQSCYTDLYSPSTPFRFTVSTISLSSSDQSDLGMALFFVIGPQIDIHKIPC